MNDEILSLQQRLLRDLDTLARQVEHLDRCCTDEARSTAIALALRLVSKAREKVVATIPLAGGHPLSTNRSEDEPWLRQLNAWTKDGTFGRLEKARDERTTVQIPRSDGSTSSGRITGFGYGGRAISVEIVGDPPTYKAVDTERFLQLNPQFGPPSREEPHRLGFEYVVCPHCNSEILLEGHEFCLDPEWWNDLIDDNVDQVTLGFTCDWDQCRQGFEAAVHRPVAPS